jgi:phosphoinositide-3-kinase regulatory subunit
MECDRTQAENYLRAMKDGTFLCRPSGRAQQSAKGGLHTHTIDIVYNGIKHLKVVQDTSGKYGFSVPCSFHSLSELIIHYSVNSLETHNPKLTTTLAFPFRA